jgi:CDP-glucose 4,6-dehydratase
MGTANVLEAARRAGSACARVVCVTTDKCYENLERAFPYARATRSAATTRTAQQGVRRAGRRAYRDTFLAELGIAVASSARAGNVIGGGDWATTA